MNPLKGELEYGSISLDDKEDYRLYRYSDAGMGETEYRIFRNGAFFAMFDNRKDAEEVMTVMTYKSERDTVLDVGGILESLCKTDLYWYNKGVTEGEDVGKCRGKDCNYCGRYNEKLRQQAGEQ